MSGGDDKWVFGLPYWSKWVVVSIAVGLAVIQVFNYYAFLPVKYYGYGPKAGEFGDSFGYINALFSALAFAGVVVTLVMQITELRNQREELSGTRRSHEEIASLNLIASYLSAMEAFESLKSKGHQTQTDGIQQGLGKIELILDYFEPKIDMLLEAHVLGSLAVKLAIEAFEALNQSHETGQVEFKNRRAILVGRAKLREISRELESASAIKPRPYSTLAFNFKSYMGNIPEILKEHAAFASESPEHEFRLKRQDLESIRLLWNFLSAQEKKIGDAYSLSRRGK